MELYIHIPFCVKKCDYCDFLSFSADEQTQRAYVAALQKELVFYGAKYKGCRITTIFIGGGTPSWLREESMQAVMEAVYKNFAVDRDAEITIECNPGTVTEHKFEVYRKIGINRLSIGLQSAHNDELKILGRIHTYEQFLKTYDMARKHGFTNINIDLMSSLPGQTPEIFCDSMHRVLQLKPEHISAYSLIIEEGTPFFDEYGETDCAKKKKKDAAKLLPSEDEVVQMDELTWKLLGEAGYEHYEISNYALPESVCRHNLKYWHCEEYLGVGTGAASYMKTNSSGDYCRLKVITDTKAFSEIDWNDPSSLDKCFAECDILSLQEQMEEMAFLGLRTKEGVRLSSFYERFGKSFNEVYGEVVKKYTAMGMMKADETHVALTLKGMEVANWIMADFCG